MYPRALQILKCILIESRKRSFLGGQYLDKVSKGLDCARPDKISKK